MGAPYQFKRTKKVELASRQVVYSLKLITNMATDPGDDLSVDLFEEYVKHLRKLRSAKKKVRS